MNYLFPYENRGDIQRLMNHATIDLEDPTEEDFGWMKQIIGEFVAETESVIGKRILDHWARERGKFVKVSGEVIH